MPSAVPRRTERLVSPCSLIGRLPAVRTRVRAAGTGVRGPLSAANAGLMLLALTFRSFNPDTNEINQMRKDYRAETCLARSWNGASEICAMLGAVSERSGWPMSLPDQMYSAVWLSQAYCGFAMTVIVLVPLRSVTGMVRARNWFQSKVLAKLTWNVGEPLTLMSAGAVIRSGL